MQGKPCCPTQKESRTRNQRADLEHNKNKSQAGQTSHPTTPHMTPHLLQQATHIPASPVDWGLHGNLDFTVSGMAHSRAPRIRADPASPAAASFQDSETLASCMPAKEHHVTTARNLPCYMCYMAHLGRDYRSLRESERLDRANISLGQQFSTCGSHNPLLGGR